MAKKLIIIIGSIIVLALIVAVVLWLSSSGNKSNAGSGASNEVSVPATGMPAGLVAPTGTTIQIGTSAGTVTVKNFYKNVIGYEDEFLTLASTTDYAITYDTVNSSFYIELSSANMRAEGEQALDGLLGTSNADACKLNIREGWPGSPTTVDAQPKLSFCG